MKKSWVHLKTASSILLCLGITPFLQGCSLPNAGPLAGEVKNTKGIEIISVTPELAMEMAQQLHIEEQDKLSAALAKLSAIPHMGDYVLQPGDSVDVVLWSFADGASAAQATSVSSGPTATKLGSYQIDESGTITLPYVGRISIANHTFNAAREIIASRYAKLGIVRSSDVTINGSGTQNGVLVTGSTGKPQLIPWNSGGITLDRAITLALGNGTTTLSDNSALDTSTNAISVAIIRHGEEVNLPIFDALNREIPLVPSDKVIIRRRPAVQVTVIGGGITRPGLYGFSKPESLAATLAEAQGLNPNAANSTHIFVFRQTPNNQKPILYNVSWENGSGLIAAQRFPVADQDIVYVAESPIVPISRVLNTIFQMAMPATMAR